MDHHYICGHCKEEITARQEVAVVGYVAGEDVVCAYHSAIYPFHENPDCAQIVGRNRLFISSPTIPIKDITKKAAEMANLDSGIRLELKKIE